MLWEHAIEKQPTQTGNSKEDLLENDVSAEIRMVAIYIYVKTGLHKIKG